MQHNIRRLPDTELLVMQAVWSCEAPVPRAVLEQAMAEIHPMAQTTLLTLVTRLAGKGFIRVEKQGRSSVYTPLVSEKEYTREQSRSFVDRVFRGNMAAFASALTDGGLKPEEIAELRHLLDKEEL